MLGLLANDVTAQVLELCAAAPQAEAQLVEATGASRATLASRLGLLEVHGLLSTHSDRTGSAGRPRTVWCAAERDAVARFGRVADAFALELLDAIAAQQREDIEARRREEVRPAETDG